MSAASVAVTASADAAHAHLATLNSPASAPTAIAAANTALTNLNTSLNSDSALHLASHLLSPALASPPIPISASAAHFAFLVLDTHLLSSTRPYADLPQSARTALRSLAVSLPAALTPAQPPLLARKAVSFLSALALREWPQLWPDFLDSLLSPSAPPALACRVLHELSEDVYHFSDRIAANRLKELRHALALALPQILPFVTRVAAAAHDAVTRDAADAAAADALVASLDALHSVVAWADLAPIFEAGVPPACITLLRSPHTREQALKVLDALVARSVLPSRSNGAPLPSDPANAPPDHAFRHLIFAALLKFLSESSLLYFVPYALVRPAGALPALSAAFEAPPPNLASVDQDDHAFLLSFLALLVDLGCRHFSTCFLYVRPGERVKILPDDRTVAYAFVDVLSVALASPSQAIQNAVFPFFTSMLSTITRFAKTPEGTRQELDDMLNFILNGFLRAGSTALISVPGDAAAAAFTELDDADDAISLQVYSLKSRVSAALIVAARLNSSLAITMAFANLNEVLRNKPNPLSLDVQPAAIAGARLSGIVVNSGEVSGWKFGLFAPEHSRAWLACLTAASKFADSAGQTLLPGMQSGDMAISDWKPSQDLPEIIPMALQGVLSLSDAPARAAKATSLRMFAPLYLINTSALDAAVSALMEMVQQTVQDRTVRIGALSSLGVVFRRLSNSGAQSISRFAKPLCEFAGKALGSREFRHGEQLHVLEATLASVLSLSAFEERVAGVELVVNPLLAVLTAPSVEAMLREPRALFDSLSGASGAEVDHFAGTLSLLEAAVHQVVRPLSKVQTPLSFPGVLSRTIAPKAAMLGSALIAACHGLYNSQKFSLPSAEDLINVLHPTCRELADPLNLANNESISRMYTGEDNDGEQKAGSIEERSEELLRATGFPPPSPGYRRLREHLRDIRRSGYEILRATIFSGVTVSHQHINLLISAVSTDLTSIEPMHLGAITAKILTPLFSFSVCSANADYLQVVANSNVPLVVRHIRELVEASQKNTAIFSETKLLDIARDHGRASLPRMAADMLSHMFPRDSLHSKDQKEEHTNFIPSPLLAGKLGEELIALWVTICSPSKGVPDKGGANVAYGTLVTAVRLAPDHYSSLFDPLTVSAFRYLVLNSGSSEALSATPMSALLAISRRWPAKTEVLLCAAVGEGEKSIHKWIKEFIDNSRSMEGANAVKSKKLRANLRVMIEKIAQQKGTSAEAKSMVFSLPDKLKTVNLTRKLKKAQQEQEDLLLGDQALDSLFGEGEPL